MPRPQVLRPAARAASRPWLLAGVATLAALLATGASATEARRAIYTPAPGDTPFSVARRFGVPASTLRVQRNGTLALGVPLVLPAGAADGAPAGARRARGQVRLQSVTAPAAAPPQLVLASASTSPQATPPAAPAPATPTPAPAPAAQNPATRTPPAGTATLTPPPGAVTLQSSSPVIAPGAATTTPARTRLNPTSRVMQFAVPLNEQGRYLGDVEVRIGTDDSVQVSPSQVAQALERTLDAQTLAALRAAVAPEAFLPIAQFTAFSLPLTFDPSSLSLSVEIPGSVRARQSFGLADLDRQTYGDFIAPARFSAYLNVRGSVDYVHQGASTGFTDALFLTDGAMRFRGFVLENEASFSTEDARFRREGTRLVYDDAPRLNRYTAGDLLPQGRGFQGVQDIAGLSIERAYGLLDPQRNIAPRGGRTFTLEREATVEAFVNGRVVRTLRLQPGTYDVSDFPFVSGANDVDVVVQDSTGRREVLSFSIFIDRTQLAPGLSEYGAYFGVATNRLGDSIDYGGGLAGSGFYRRGISENLTLGGNFQFSERGALAGVEWVYGSGFGSIGGDVAVSQLDNGGAGWAVNLTYERLIQDRLGGSSLSATLEARSRRFGAPSQIAPDNRYILNAAVAYNRSFGDSQFVGAQLRYAMAREGFESETSLRLTYGRRITETTNVILDADLSSGGFADGASFRVAIVRRFGATGSMRAEYDSQSERARVGYQTSGGRGVGAWSVAGTVEGGSSDVGFNGAAAYAANRADLGIAHTTSYSLDTSAISDQRTSFRAASSIAFADGAFAVGRPVTDAFAIVRPYRSGIAGIEVDPSPEGYYARSGALGPALYGQLGSYSPRSIVYDAPDAPAGFDIGSGSARVLAPYRAGYLLTVGSDYGVTAIGRLLDASGEPIPLLSGHAVEQGGEGRSVDVFTNRSGAFGASGLRPGRWRITLIDGRSFDFTVPETANAVARVGDIRPRSP